MIGGGGMGAVFRARDEHLDRTVAIKVIPFVGDDPDLQRRFRNEAQSAAKLDHPRIARVYDVGHHDEWHYIVFEYIEGTNIRDLVTSNGVLSIDEAVFYTSQLADALQHASDRGIVHRDIKPSNILICGEGGIKLVDMGLARSDNLDFSEDMTASGVTLGTFDYISPEQAHDPRIADFRSDIYSLGCTLYFMLTGSPPYPGGTMLQKLLSHGNAPPPDARELRGEVSSNLVAVIRKMLDKKPAGRYQTAADLIADLREVAFRDGLLQSQSLSPVAVALPSPMTSWLEKHLPWLVAVGLLLASAGWLQLESIASRTELTIPKSADRPEIGYETEILPLTDPPVIPLSDVDLATSTTLVPSLGDPVLGVPSLGVPSLGVRGDDALIGEASRDRAMEQGGSSFFGDGRTTDSSFGTGFPELDQGALDPLAKPIPSTIRVIGTSTAAQDANADGVMTASSLKRALELAHEFNASSVEIAVRYLESEPIKVETDDLRISSVVGGSTIRFQSSSQVSMERSKMFAIGSHPVELDQLHFLWDVPNSEVDGGSLFELNDGRIEMTDCTVTVSNPTKRKEVYAFEVITDPNNRGFRALSDEFSDELAVIDPFPRVAINLKNVIVRGEMSMLHMDYATELLLFWNNGLLAVTDRMIDTAGARQAPPTSAGPIQLSLTRVTAHAPKGLLEMRIGVSSLHPVSVDRFARNSVFYANVGEPHFLFSGLSWTGEPPTLLQLRGLTNAYVVEPSLGDPMLRMISDQDQTIETRMSDLLTSTPSWADDASPKWSVNWSADRLVSEMTQTLASQRTIAEYRQDGDSPSGFEEALLPSLPEDFRLSNGDFDSDPQKTTISGEL
jgi:serine/threonine-protein kinase